MGTVGKVSTQSRVLGSRDEDADSQTGEICDKYSGEVIGEATQDTA